jgi:outer membrane protein, heavy metal efflux system
MHSIKYLYGLALILLLAVYVAGCSTSKPAIKWTPLDTSAFSEPLTLAQCLDLSKKNDIRTAQWKARLQAAHAGLTQSRVLPNPTLGITWDDVGLKNDAGMSISTVTYGITYPIMFWWSRGLKIKAAKINQQSEEAAVNSEKRQLDIEIASAYFNLVADQRKVALTEDISKGAGELFRLAQKQSGFNDISGFALEQARLELNKAESDLKEAQNKLRADQLSFAFALGADRPFYPAVADCGDEYLQVQGIPTKNEKLSDEDLKTAVDKDPDYVQKQLAADYAAAKLGIERLNIFPLADTVASGGPKKSDEGNSATYSVEVPIPLLDQNKAGRENAQAELLSAQADEEKARRDAIAGITSKWDLYHTLAWKWEQYSNNSNQLAEKNIKTAARLYEMGRLTYAELLQSQRDYKNIQIDAVDTWQQLSAASWELSAALGKQ